jgi:hypothetical protein
MKSILSVIFLSAALAGPAAAEDIRISLADKDAAAVRAEIDRAAATVCLSAFREGAIETQGMLQCPGLVSADALDQAKAAEAGGAMASNDLAQAAASR